VRTLQNSWWQDSADEGLSLRAKRSNPSDPDCFVAGAPRNDKSPSVNALPLTYFGGGDRSEYSIIQRWIRACLLLGFLLAFFPMKPAQGCDDAILLLVSGANPGDRFCKQLLDMSRSLRDMAGDLLAYNNMAAGRKLDGLLKSWIQFDTGIMQSPPSALQEDPDGQRKVKHIADLLGLIKGLFDRQDFDGAHSLIEPVVIKMSALSSLVLRQKSLQDFLSTEFLLTTLKPGFQGLSNQDSAAALASFSLEIEALRPKLPPETQKPIAEISHSASEFQAILKGVAEPRRSQVATEYTSLMNKFAGLKKELLDRKWFTSGK